MFFYVLYFLPVHYLDQSLKLCNILTYSLKLQRRLDYTTHWLNINLLFLRKYFQQFLLPKIVAWKINMLANCIGFLKYRFIKVDLDSGSGVTPTYLFASLVISLWRNCKWAEQILPEPIFNFEVYLDRKISFLSYYNIYCMD